jgi:hypothetical protein
MRERPSFYPAFGMFRLYGLELATPIMLSTVAFLVLFEAIQFEWLVGWFR